ncbi:MAG TPA: response regulator [Ruania sp.]|nr:response regulator [Ruania sp.]
MTDELRVLIVDDDFHVARLHVEYVQSVPGFRALEPVGTAKSTLEAVAKQQPDLVLLDVYLPDALGLDLLRTLDTDAFLLTAAAEADAIRKAFRRGALGYLIKPFAPERLGQLLRAYARYRRLLAGQESIDQNTIERALGGLMPAQGTASTRARSATERAVLSALQTGEDSSAVEVARAVGVSRATAQRYLAALADEGTIYIQLQYGATGRPEHRYGLVT